MTANSSTFRHAALLSELVTQDQFDEAISALQGESRGDGPVLEVDDNLLARQLIETKVLTEYQAHQLACGRTKFNLGPYLVIDSIGRGGMGEVYMGVHKIMGREVALKVLPKSRSTPESIANFSREIRTQAKLDHPNLVRAYDAGQVGSVYYLVTEFVPGADLRRLVRNEGPLNMQQASNIIMQAAKGLSYAHQQGLIHRDVKPGNILVTPEGLAKVSDLGLAGCVKEAEQDPRAGKVVGTADYLSPEQIKTPRDITPVSDIYSLGCAFYYAVTGKVPYPGGKASDKARRHLQETPWHPRRFNTELSEEFVEIIAEMMEKDPKLRIASADEVVARLEPWASETSPLPNRLLAKSPWMPPPLPNTSDEEIDAHEVEESHSHSQSHSQGSVGTLPEPAASHDTTPLRRAEGPVVPPPLPIVSPPPILTTAIVAGVIGMILGAALMHFLM